VKEVDMSALEKIYLTGSPEQIDEAIKDSPDAYMKFNRTVMRIYDDRITIQSVVVTTGLNSKSNKRYRSFKTIGYESYKIKESKGVKYLSSYDITIYRGKIHRLYEKVPVRLQAQVKNRVMDLCKKHIGDPPSDLKCDPLLWYWKPLPARLGFFRGRYRDISTNSRRFSQYKCLNGISPRTSTLDDLGKKLFGKNYCKSVKRLILASENINTVTSISKSFDKWVEHMGLENSVQYYASVLSFLKKQDDYLDYSEADMESVLAQVDMILDVPRRNISKFVRPKDINLINGIKYSMKVLKWFNPEYMYDVDFSATPSEIKSRISKLNKKYRALWGDTAFDADTPSYSYSSTINKALEYSFIVPRDRKELTEFSILFDNDSHLFHDKILSGESTILVHPSYDAMIEITNGSIVQIYGKKDRKLSKPDFIELVELIVFCGLSLYSSGRINEIEGYPA